MREYRTTILPDCLCHDSKATTSHLTTRCTLCVNPEQPIRVCPKCKLPRPESCFGNGLNTCSVCRAYGRQHHIEQRSTRNPKDVARIYGMPVEQYLSLQEQQGGLCAICGKPQDQESADGRRYALHVDHSHKTGKIRGLICLRCNQIIGWMEQHDWETIRKAWEHISRELEIAS